MFWLPSCCRFVMKEPVHSTSWVCIELGNLESTQEARAALDSLLQALCQCGRFKKRVGDNKSLTPVREQRKGQADSHLQKVENKQVKGVNTLYSKRGIARESIALLKILKVRRNLSHWHLQYLQTSVTRLEAPKHCKVRYHSSIAITLEFSKCVVTSLMRASTVPKPQHQHR